MAKDNTVSNAEFAREMRNRETFALLRTFAMAVLSSFDDAPKTPTEHKSERNKGVHDG